VRLLFIINLAGKVAAVMVWAAEPCTALALWLVPDAILAYHLFAPHAQGIVRAPGRFATSRREVWLTIDDGPDPEDTPRILELLAAHGAHATFFLIGENAARHPQIVREIAAAGHEVAHHTHTHPHGTFWIASPARLRRELDGGLAALSLAGVTPTRFRPPVGFKNFHLARALRGRGLTCIGWSARGLERWRGNVDRVAERVLRKVSGGSILLLHEGPGVPDAVRVEAIRRVLERLKELGYACVVPEAAQLAD
jgi:peptidoglycan/xylan/chitin deacetylase (PgdA/CDA1 family)